MQAIFYSLAALSLVGVLIGIYDNVLIWRRGKKEDRFQNLGRRLWSALRITARNRSVVREDRYAGVMHFLIMLGIIILFIGTVLLTIHEDTPFKFLVGANYLVYDITLDFFGILLIIGILMAFYRRYIIRPAKISSIFEDRIVLSTLLLIAVTGILVEGLRLAITQPLWEYTFAPMGYAFGLPFFGLPEDTLRGIHFGVWWTHAISALSLIAYAPFSKLFHIMASALNIVFQSHYPKGWIPPMPEGGPVKDITDWSWKRIMDFDACTSCGRCTDACPATAAGRDLQPMKIIQSLKAYSKSRYSFKARYFGGASTKPLVGEDGFITPEELWGCTTCRACMEVCPVNIEHVYDIVDLRRNLIEEGEAPDSGMKVLNHMFKTSNAYGLPQGKRTEWAKGLNVKDISQGGSADYVLFVGCLASFDARTQKIAQALVKLLQRAGVDFAILGKDEFCSGHEARRMGEEGLFEMLADKNLAAFSKRSVKKIITISPHCFNTIKNDYPARGFDGGVRHYTQLIADLVEEGKITFSKNLDVVVTFHDPCYLGRHNEEYEAPRRILRAIPGVKIIEMPRCRENSFCCGGGGGGYWLEVQRQSRRMSEIRVLEAASIRPNVLIVACPFCMNNFEDAVKITKTDSWLSIKDVVELAAEAI